MKVSPQAALSLSLLLHELATNAAKYGALFVKGGIVSLDWKIDSEAFRLRWKENGGPPACAPVRRGFGSRLIAMGICGSRDVDLRYTDRGFEAEFAAPIKSVTAE